MVPLAVAVTLATPEALVSAEELESTALAPIGGTPKVTVAPDTGFPAESFTVVCSAVAKAEPDGADWGVPPVAVILAGTVPVPELLVLVNENDAESVPALAVTK
jgi:hypothetical protein